MPRIASRTLVALSAAVVCLTAAASERLEPRTSRQGGVTVTVSPRNVTGNLWEFEVVMDTHTVALNDDLARSAVLVTPEGEVPASWRGDGPGGHHRKGVLTFKAPASGPRTITIRLMRPGEAQARSFQWERK